MCVLLTDVPLALSLSWINSSMRSEKFGLALPTSVETGRAFGTTSSLLANNEDRKREIFNIHSKKKSNTFKLMFSWQNR